MFLYLIFQFMRAEHVHFVIKLDHFKLWIVKEAAFCGWHVSAVIISQRMLHVSRFQSVLSLGGHFWLLVLNMTTTKWQSQDLETVAQKPVGDVRITSILFSMGTPVSNLHFIWIQQQWSSIFIHRSGAFLVCMSECVDCFKKTNDCLNKKKMLSGPQISDFKILNITFNITCHSSSCILFSGPLLCYYSWWLSLQCWHSALSLNLLPSQVKTPKMEPIDQVSSSR